MSYLPSLGGPLVRLEGMRILVLAGDVLYLGGVFSTAALKHGKKDISTAGFLMRKQLMSAVPCLNFLLVDVRESIKPVHLLNLVVDVPETILDNGIRELLVAIHDVALGIKPEKTEKGCGDQLPRFGDLHMSCLITYGALDMLSMPPANMISRSPDLRAWAAIMIDFMPEAHTLLMVVASVDSGQPVVGPCESVFLLHVKWFRLPAPKTT